MPRLLYVLPCFLIIVSSLIFFFQFPTSPPAPDEAVSEVGWQIYTDLQEGISLEYPPNFNLEQAATNQDSSTLIFRKNLIQILLHIQPSNYPEPVDFSQFEKYRTPSGSSTQIFIETIGTTTWVIRSEKSGLKNAIDYSAATFKNGKSYTLGIGSDKQLVSNDNNTDIFRILSTFKFLEK